MQCIKCHADLPADALYCPRCGKKQTPEKRKALKRANGMGTVYKLQGRRKRPWVAAKNKVIIGYYEKKTDALEALERLTGKPLSERYNMTFSEVYREWSEEHFKKLTPSGITAYIISYKAFSPLHNKKFRDLRTADFQAIIDANKNKVEMVKKYRQLLGQMSKWAMREEVSSQNFAQFLQLPPSDKKQKEIFTEDEIQKLEQDDLEAAKIVLMLLATGMRIGELFSLPLSNYYGNYVIGGSKTEAGKNRVVPIRPEGRKYFSYFANQATGDLLLSGYTGARTAQNFRQRNYYPLLDRLHIPRKSPHATRHTYASRAVKEGMPPEILQKILGHASYTTTADIYTHMDIETLVQAVEAVNVTSGLQTNREIKKSSEI